MRDAWRRTLILPFLAATLLGAWSLVAPAGPGVAQRRPDPRCLDRCERERRRCDRRCAGPGYEACHSECNSHFDRCRRERCGLRPPPGPSPGAQGRPTGIR
ncbi:MAG TPA: hypothetical protein RMH99_25115 [Sandaracinaceae bacterium LLY-WYZ-13_1]|nr:hypothetical protein [Sandaracinaceae bacterium LLY-WYZ-13_1]